MQESISTEIIKKRISCRNYTGEPLSEKDRKQLEDLLASGITGPFGGKPEFILAAAESGDTEALKGLGTYGFIRKPAGFIIGAVSGSPMMYEDFGYCMEKLILHATAMGLGTCWLGGTFRKSSFAEKAGIMDGRQIPAVTATGYAADKKSFTERLIRASAGSDKRKPVNELFFELDMTPVPESFFSTDYGTALEMTRIAPSASNKQPWRIVRDITGKDFHLFMERTAGYNNNRFLKSDLQRIDMGIAMCHFELAAADLGIDGKWEIKSPEIKTPRPWEYIASWSGK